MKEQLLSIQENGGELKEVLWAWLDGNKIPEEVSKRTKDAMNELLDELDCLHDYVVEQARKDFFMVEVKVQKIFEVRNKVWSLLFSDREQAEQYLSETGTPSTGLHIEERELLVPAEQS